MIEYNPRRWARSLLVMRGTVTRRIVWRIAAVAAWSSILYSPLIAFVLLGIEEIGVEIENPFGSDANDLPLEQICRTIDQNLAAVLHSSVTNQES